MTVYLDGEHMVADTLFELDAMAVRLGINRKERRGDHYLIAPGQRSSVVLAGGRQIAWQQLAYMSQLRRRNINAIMISPERAEELIDARIRPEDAPEWQAFGAEAWKPIE
jgi:hypothetical protein